MARWTLHLNRSCAWMATRRIRLPPDPGAVSPRSAPNSRAAIPKDARTMRSWIFRQRLRLRAVYGTRPSPPVAQASPQARSGKRSEQGLAPGQCGRRGGSVWLRPNVPELA
jgi:hypothetical protein